MTAILALAVLFGLYGVNRGDVNLPQRVASLYTATSRFAWSLFLAWLTLACSAGYGGKYMYSKYETVGVPKLKKMIPSGSRYAF